MRRAARFCKPVEAAWGIRSLRSRRGRTEVVELLLSRGARVSGRCIAQATAKEHDGVVALLRSAGGEPSL